MLQGIAPEFEILSAKSLRLKLFVNFFTRLNQFLAVANALGYNTGKVVSIGIGTDADDSTKR